MKHHINRFFSSSQVYREQPFYFYIITILWGLVPWIFSAISAGIAKLANLKKFSLKNLDDSHKFLYFNVIAFFVIMLFFSASSTKLITYILPVYFFTACIMAFLWEDYMFKGKYEKSVNISVYILGVVCILSGIGACFMKYFLPAQIYADIDMIQWFCVILVLVFGISSILCARFDKKTGVFACYVLLVLITSAFGTKLFYNMDYEFGQNDLMYFAKYAKENNKKLVILNDERKYSAFYYYGGHVYFISQDDEAEMKKFGQMLDDKDVVVIVRERKMPKVDETLDFDIILDGRKYSLIKVK